MTKHREAADKDPTDQDATDRYMADKDAGLRTGGNRRLAAGGVVLLAAAALLTGCGTKDSGSASAPESVAGPATPASGDASSTAPTPTGGDTTAPGSGRPSSPQSSATRTAPPSKDAATPAAPAKSTRCHTSELSASVGPNSPGAGQENFALVLTNRSGRTCTVHGFPGLAFVNSADKQVSGNPARTGSPTAAVRLAPGRSAWAALSFTNPGITGASVVTPAAVRITPPDETASLKATWSGGPVPNTDKGTVPKVGAFNPGTAP